MSILRHKYLWLKTRRYSRLHVAVDSSLVSVTCFPEPDIVEQCQATFGNHLEGRGCEGGRHCEVKVTGPKNDNSHERRENDQKIPFFFLLNKKKIT